MARWTRDELLLALGLYFETPFGQQHKNHAPIVKLAESIGRTPSAVAMKLCNFTSLDKTETARGIKGLTGASKADNETWIEFENHKEKLVDEIEALRERQQYNVTEETADTYSPATDVLTERSSVTKQRRHQNFFRKVVLGSYRTQCCITGISLNELLRASHIVPWSESVSNRLNPQNGLCLSATFDAAFDRGLITVDSNYQLLLSKRIHMVSTNKEILNSFVLREGMTINLPEKNLPDIELLQWHSENIFDKPSRAN